MWNHKRLKQSSHTESQNPATMSGAFFGNGCYICIEITVFRHKSPYVFHISRLANNSFTERDNINRQYYLIHRYMCWSYLFVIYLGLSCPSS